MKNILIISGHPDLKKSFANKEILKLISQQIPAAEHRTLDTLYPDYGINVLKEQQCLVSADIIVLQFPLFWYGVPSLMKKWMEDVFVYGFSHGSQGSKLSGKRIIFSFTSGASEEMYRPGGMQNYFIEDFMPPLKQFATLCGMECTGYIYTGGLSYIADSAQQRAKMLPRVRQHAERLLAKISE